MNLNRLTRRNTSVVAAETRSALAMPQSKVKFQPEFRPVVVDLQMVNLVAAGTSVESCGAEQSAGQSHG